MRNIALAHTLACTQFLRQCTGRLWNILQQHVNSNTFRKRLNPSFFNGKVVKHWRSLTRLNGVCPGRQSKLAGALSNLLQLSWLWVGRIPRGPTSPSDLLAGSFLQKYHYNKKPLSTKFLKTMRLCPTVCPTNYHCLYWFLSQGWSWPLSQRMLMLGIGLIQHGCPCMY